MKQKKVIVYTFKRCPYCVKAKRLLNSEHIEFTEIEVSDDKLEELAQRTKMSTVPQIIVDDVLIGGCDDLYKLHQNRQLFKETFYEIG